jgi:hypothetical protein
MWERTVAFWQDRDAWGSNRIVAQAKAKKMHADMSLQRKAIQWSLKAPSYMRNAPSAAPKQVVLPPSDIGEAAAMMLERLAPALAEAFDREMAAVMANAWRQWPVYSGLSKSLLDLSYDMDGAGQFVAVLRSTAPYTIFIKSEPHRKLLELPGIEAAKRVAQVALSAVANG